jgi:hypothetical protein
MPMTEKQAQLSGFCLYNITVTTRFFSLPCPHPALAFSCPKKGKEMDLLGLAFCVPFFIAALMAHFGVNFSEDNYDTGEKK